MPPPLQLPTLMRSSPLQPLHEAKRRRLGSSPLSCPASPSAASTAAQSDPEITEWWSLDQLSAQSPCRFALEALRQYLREWKTTPQDPFWTRKSGKPVLSVVVCRKREGGLQAHRGMNTEVSLPAGSLCAEIAAIARAASDFAQASDVIAIATADPTERLNPLWPCEVCQSWLAKLRVQSQEISVIAVASSACDAFALRVNGELQLPFQLPPLASSVTERIVLAEGSTQWPWEARELVYIDGAWTFLHSAQQKILKEARARGTHLLVGVHSDKVLQQEYEGPCLENFETRLGRILQNRHVCSVLKDAPWCVTQDLINDLGIRKVVSGTVSKMQDVGTLDHSIDPYRVARELGILEVIPSLDGTTERSVHETHVARARTP